MASSERSFWRSRMESGAVGMGSSEVDLENGNGVLEMKVHSNNNNNNTKDDLELERECRICQLGFEVELEGENENENENESECESDNRSDCGVPIHLGCSCKGDLGSAHKHCAETWFKIKGDTTCEICGVTAQNIVSSNERNSESNPDPAAAPATAPVIVVETIWHGRRIMNFLLACMVLAFITSWLFHFKIL